LSPKPTSATLAAKGDFTMSNEQRQRREKVSARLDPAVIEVIERVAEVERRPVSSVVRNVLADWAKAHGRSGQEPRAA
jgi:hypothetical protein